MPLTLHFDPQHFAANIIAWQKQHGRHDLPWQIQPTAYKTWISEIMCQQTQVAQAIPYFLKFIEKFPNITSLANADQQRVLLYWSGLGYYSRARNLHACAKILQSRYQATLPHSLSELMALPGIGRSTAGAIMSLAYQTPAAILDGNVKRVLSRIFNLKDWPGRAENLKWLWQMAEQLSNNADPYCFSQGMMDLGASLCSPKHPQCHECPVKTVCLAFQNGHPHPCPAPKPKRAIPTKNIFWLCVIKQQKIFVIQQPSPGLWGGLYCPPQFETQSELNSVLKSQSIKLLATLPKFRHVFTHFKLDIQPLIYQGTLSDQLAYDGDWQSIQQPLHWPHPQPVAKCIKRIIEQVSFE